MPLSDLLQRAQAARCELIESQLETRFWDIFNVSTQWNHIQKLHPYRQEPLLNGFIFEYRMGCIFFWSPGIETVQRLSAPAAGILIATWKSRKETSRDGLSPSYSFTGHYPKAESSMFETTSAMAEPTKYQVMRQSLIQLPAVLTLICLLRPEQSDGKLLFASPLLGSLRQRGRDFEHQGLEKHIRKRNGQLQIAFSKPPENE